MTAELLRSRLHSDMQLAMKASSRAEVSALRQIVSALQKADKASGQPIEDPQIVALLQKLLKQSQESERYFRQADRTEQVEKEQFEQSIIQKYLPQPLDELTLQQEVEAALTAVAAQGMADRGKVMAYLKTSLAGRADFKQVAERVRLALDKKANESA